MASLNTGEKKHLSILAVSKQDAALKDFRPQLENITPQNCDATFAFSFLAEYYIPASAGTVVNPAATFMEDEFFDAIVDRLRSHEGTSDIYKRKGHGIQSGPVASLSGVMWSDVLGERRLSPTRKAIIGDTNTHQLHSLARIWKTDTASTMSGFHENQVNSRVLGIPVEALSLVLEDSKTFAGRIAVNELLNNPQLPKDHNPQRAERSNSLGFVQLLEQ
ncbi:hypothetical protein N7522_008932 [Penicillium canescens]|nr:hypothetical protein N7522_008932 [Penicillium canescens]